MSIPAPLLGKKHASEEPIIGKEEEGEKRLWGVGDEDREYETAACARGSPGYHLFGGYGAVA